MEYNIVIIVDRMIPFGTGNTDINPSIDAGIAEEGGILIYDVARKFWEGSNRMKVSPSATTYYNDAGTVIGYINDNGFNGNGSQLTGFTASQIPNISASKITSGTLDNLRLNTDRTFSRLYTLTADEATYIQGDALVFMDVLNNEIAQIDKYNGLSINKIQALTGDDVAINDNLNVSGVISGNGSGITDLNATNIASGTINNDRLPTTPTFNGINFNTLSSGDWAKLYTEGTVDDENFEDNGHRLVLELGDDEDDPAEFIIRRYLGSEVLFVVEYDGRVTAKDSFNAPILNTPLGQITTLNSTTINVDNIASKAGTYINIDSGDWLVVNKIKAHTDQLYYNADTHTFNSTTGSSNYATINSTNFTINNGLRINGASYDIEWNAGLGRIQSLDPWKIGGLFLEPPASSTVVPFTMKQNNATQPMIALFSDDSNAEIMSVNETNVSIPTKSLNFGNSTRQMLNLWGTAYGVGVQSSTTYFRTGDSYAWFKGGVHNETQFNSGDGTTQMVLNGSGNLGIGLTNPAYKLDVLGSFNVNNTGTVFEVGSDRLTHKTVYNLWYTEAGTEKMRLDTNTGRLGLGTNDPQYTLDVNGTTRLGGDTTTSGNITYTDFAKQLYIERINFNSKASITWTFYSASTLYQGADNFVWRNKANTSGDSIMNLNTSTGNLGIGTTAPEAKLHIETSALSATAGQSQIGLSIKMPSINNDRILFYNYRFSTGFDWTTARQTITRVVDSTYLNYIKFDGDYTRMGDFRYGGEFTFNNNTNSLGIGILNPTRKLHVYSNKAGSADQGFKVEATNTTNTDYLTAEWSPGYMTNHVRWTIRNKAQYHLFEDSGGTERMRVNWTGNVGIGKNNPLAKLEVSAGANSTVTAPARYFRHSIGLTYSATNTETNVSIFADGDIVSKDYIVSHNGNMSASDRRIKENIEDISDTEALDTLRLLKPKTYTYKDTIGRGSEKVIGFIAQEVKEVLPLATDKRYDAIPNIYELANVSESNVITFTNFNTSNLTANTLIDAKTETSGDMRLTIEEIIDEHSLKVKEDIEGEQIFVMGEYVDDFTFLKKDYIWTIATSALQEVDRQQQADKARISTLESLVQTLMEEVAVLKAQGIHQTSS